VKNEKCVQWLENLKGRDLYENLGIVGRIILEWILEKYHGELTGFILLRIGTSVGLSVILLLVVT
jgi:uncharacterized membrane protein YeaQ/YmgE (transglycosylase-associated protein family)